MNNSLFLCLLKYIRSMDIRDKSLVNKQIDEYINWLSLSIILGKEHYFKYKDTLLDIQHFIYDHNCMEIREYLTDLISMYYIISGEDEVSL